MGETHEILQGERGDQSDPLMPLLFSLAQHRSSLAINARLIEGESLFAFWVGDVNKVIQQELCSRANIQVHHGKTKVWIKQRRAMMQQGWSKRIPQCRLGTERCGAHHAREWSTKETATIPC